jgi:serine/threonine-protein kinase
MTREEKDQSLKRLVALLSALGESPMPARRAMPTGGASPPSTAPNGGEATIPDPGMGLPAESGDRRAEIGPWPDEDELLRLIEEVIAADHCDGGPHGMPRGSERFGRYLILREIARGQFSSIYLASGPRSDRRVALKVARPETMADPALRRRFELETKVASGLDHPNIVPADEVGQVGGLFYIAMAYVGGGTLSDWPHVDAPPDPRQAAWLVREIAGGLGHAHDRGILHLDLKPANILLGLGIPSSPDDPGVVPRIIDFGLARLLDEGDGEPDGAALIGSPPYMASEQVLQGASGCGPPTDIYALGAILYELLVGRPPFLGANRLETIRAVVEGGPVPPRRLRPSIPSDLEVICLRCLERSPARRYSTAGALRDDLGRFLDGGQIPTPTPAP